MLEVQCWTRWRGALLSEACGRRGRVDIKLYNMYHDKRHLDSGRDAVEAPNATSSSDHRRPPGGGDVE